MGDTKIPLKAAIAALRKELTEASAAAPADKDKRFKVTDVELELTIVADDGASVGGEVGWWIFKGKAEETSKNSLSHKIKLKLDVGPIEVSDTTRTK